MDVPTTKKIFQREDIYMGTYRASPTIAIPKLVALPAEKKLILIVYQLSRMTHLSEGQCKNILTNSTK
jgi:hypothetical protein